MDDFEKLMWEAWDKVGPMLKANPDELKARLARRRSKMFLRPVRAWCLAVRACDTRIEPYRWAMVPEDAMDVRSEWHEGRVVEHTVELRKEGLMKICAAVDAQPAGIPAYELAKLLGCTEGDLRPLRRNPAFHVEVVKGFLGRRGTGTPFFQFKHPLDPTAFAKGRPDPIWGVMWRMHAQALADDFSYILRRVPHYGRLGEKEVLRGWRWICPGCKKTARTLYYPLPVPDWGRWVGFMCGEDEVDALPGPNPCFACNRCHGMVNFSRACLRRSWNQLILHFSGGLLYGKEVKRPEWLKVERKRAYRARPRKAPMQEEMARLLAQTEMSFAEMAREMAIKVKSAERIAPMVYKRYGVANREELRRLMPREEARAAG